MSKVVLNVNLTQEIVESWTDFKLEKRNVFEQSLFLTTEKCEIVWALC